VELLGAKPDVIRKAEDRESSSSRDDRTIGLDVCALAASHTRWTMRGAC
jgi:carbamoylphosphate synthase large subunit